MMRKLLLGGGVDGLRNGTTVFFLIALYLSPLGYIIDLIWWITLCGAVGALLVIPFVYENKKYDSISHTMLTSILSILVAVGTLAILTVLLSLCPFSLGIYRETNAGDGIVILFIVISFATCSILAKGMVLIGRLLNRVFFERPN